jgi:hypothetical protein
MTPRQPFRAKARFSVPIPAEDNFWKMRAIIATQPSLFSGRGFFVFA